MNQRTAETAIAKLRRLSMLPKGTLVLARNHFQGKVDGVTPEGDYIVLFDQPVGFPSIGITVYRGIFPPADVKEIV